MSFTICYTSARPVAAEEAEAIRSAAQRECQGRSWLSCEPVHFFPDLQDGLLIGGSKPNFAPHPEDRRSAETSGLPDGGPRDVLDILARLSREHSVDWELMHDYGSLGSIRGGVIDHQALARIEALAELPGALDGEEGEEFA
jgi:hypothetical protein